MILYPYMIIDLGNISFLCDFVVNLNVIVGLIGNKMNLMGILDNNAL